MEQGVTLLSSDVFFEGHFEGDPIYPGVAQITELVLPACTTDERLRIHGVERLKFKRALRPGDTVAVALERIESGIKFSNLCEGVLVSSGVLLFESVFSQEQPPFQLFRSPIIQAKECLPHRGRMLLLDEVWKKGEVVQSSARMSCLGIFADSGACSSFVCMELLAQTAAAYMGLEAKGAGEKLSGAFLGGQFSLRTPVLRCDENTPLVSEVTLEMGLGGLAAFRGRVAMDGTCVCQGRFQVAKINSV